MADRESDPFASAGERWLLPAGIEETLPDEAARLESLRRELLDLYESWGYRLVVTPFVEYLESLLTGTGKDLDLQTFKLTDQLSGRLMGVRADMTPQVARIDVHHLRTDDPVRLCYLGTVLHALPDGVSGSRSPIQVGAELYGHAGIESDCEILCLMLETLGRANVSDVHVDLGHVGIFRGLSRQADLDERSEATIYDALQRKAMSEIAPLLDSIGDPLAGMIRDLAALNGGDEVLKEAPERLADASSEVHKALDALTSLAASLRTRFPSLPMHFDLAELRGYRYHTGMVFAAFVPGSGQEIARGGRYDNIGRDFGHARPATGFSTDLKALIREGGGRNANAPRPGILAPWSSNKNLDALIRKLRDSGERVIYELPGQSGSAAAMGCDRRIVKRGDEWTVEAAGK
ncbi:MAG: ATP phosphoribosyltransferase regulatory subunit [Gammaproteobacteria bacterium]|nr:ATP phosphoribosyltransferase regulatory subunit [Gammaproteobacteria bacterium]